MSGQAPTLDRRSRSTPARFTHVAQFLEYLGVPCNKACGRGRRDGFWKRNHGQLEWIFKDAKTAYAEAAKKAHPDNGGSHEAMTALNKGWELLKRQFSLHCRSMFRLRTEPYFKEVRYRTDRQIEEDTSQRFSFLAKARKVRWEGHTYVDKRLRRQKRYAALSPEDRALYLENKRLFMRRHRAAQKIVKVTE